MAAERTEPTIMVEAYLALEVASQTKHEYVHGYVYAMADVTLAHDLIANNVRVAIYNHLGDGPCVVRGPALLVRVREGVSPIVLDRRASKEGVSSVC
jgi:Putative restriction endonuclease